MRDNRGCRVRSKGQEVFMTVRAILADESGQSMVEYGIIVAVIAAVCIGGYRAVGGQINKTLDTLIKNMK